MFDLRRPGQLLSLVGHLGPIVIGLAGTLFAAGLVTARVADHARDRMLEAALSDARAALAAAREESAHNTEAFARQLGELRARMLRLDALGERLVDLSGLEDGEFDFAAPPSLGGPVDGPVAAAGSYLPEDLAGEIDDALVRSASRARQFDALAEVLRSRRAREQATPDGLPVRAGWISSYFGRRADPFTGHRAHHRGVDIAGRRGSPIEAVASGIVVFAGRRGGYGNLVEIDHGGGLITRYGHNEELRAQVGDTVQRGDVIATMGQTGRATGPHLHFEVHRDGRPIDPLPYIVD